MDRSSILSAVMVFETVRLAVEQLGLDLFCGLGGGWVRCLQSPVARFDSTFVSRGAFF